jgi:protein O-mannosyl-transferase
LRRYLLLSLAVLAAFGDCVRGSFHFDDYAMLADPVVNRPDGVWHLGSVLQTRPLTTLTFWVNYQVGGSSPFGFHLVNLLLHLGVVLLLFRVLQELIPATAAFLAAALFAIHPLQSEAVAYVFARGTLLATGFCLLSWRSWRSGAPWRAVAWFGAALLCKEECVAFPFILLLFGPRNWKAFAGMMGLAIATGLRTVYATTVITNSGAGFSAGISPLSYLAAQGIAILRYLRLLVVPWGFTIDPDIQIQQSWVAILAWIAIAAATALSIRYRQWIWFAAGVILLMPSSSILPAADLAADRRMYLPMIAFCPLTGLFAQKAKTWAHIAVAVLLVGLSIGRMETWRTEQSVWQEAVNRSPAKARPRIQLARTLAPSDALETLRAAPQTADVLSEAGRVYLDQGQSADALREFGKALALRPGDAHAVNNRGVALLALGQKEAARKDFERALAIDPNLRDARENLARIQTTAK